MLEVLVEGEGCVAEQFVEKTDDVHLMVWADFFEVADGASFALRPGTKQVAGMIDTENYSWQVAFGKGSQSAAIRRILTLWC